MTPLQLAVSLGQLEFVDMLIFYRANVDQKDDISQKSLFFIVSAFFFHLWNSNYFFH